MSTAEQTEQRPLAATAEADGLDAVLRETEQRRKGIVRSVGALLGVEADKVCEMLRNVWTTSEGKSPLTNQEMFTGMSLIARYELDPIAREVYVTRDGNGRLLTIIGIDGWIKILDRTDHYDGFDQELGGTDPSKHIEWVETRIFSKTRKHPTVYRAFASEYQKLGGYMAKKIPSHMLRLFSLRHAARLFTPIGGNVVTEEEARWMQKSDEGKAHDDLDKLLEAQPSDKAPASQTTTPEPTPEPLDTTPLSEDEDRQVTEYRDAITELKTIGEVDQIGNTAAKSPDLSDAGRQRVVDMCDKQKAAIRGKRGASSNER